MTKNIKSTLKINAKRIVYRGVVCGDRCNFTIGGIKPKMNIMTAVNVGNGCRLNK